MGISRDSKHKRRATGGKRKVHRKKRKFESGRPPAMTRLGPKRVHLVRCRGGNIKHRALKLDQGNFSWGSEAIAKKTRILVVVYNASNNELVRTNTLVKNSIVQIDAAPFRNWYEQHYGVALGKSSTRSEQGGAQGGANKRRSDTATSGTTGTSSAGTTGATGTSSEATTASTTATSSAAGSASGATKGAAVPEAAVKKSAHLKSKLAQRRSGHPAVNPNLSDQFNSGRLFACIASRPGQSGRCDGYILEGEELAFYLRKLKK